MQEPDVPAPTDLPAERLGPGLAELLRLQTRILREMAAGTPAQALARELCDFAHRCAGGRIASVMRLGPDGFLYPVAVTGGPATLEADLAGLVPGPQAGSCGTAIHLGAPVLVCDTRDDPRWAELRNLAERYEIRSCWSHPVWQAGAAIGTFALTGSAPGTPTPAIHRLLEHGAAIAGSILQLLDLQEDQQRQAERMRRLTGFNAMLAQVNQLAAGRPDETALYDGICRIAVAQAGLRLVWIGAPDAAGVFHPAAACGATDFLDNVFVTADPAMPEGNGLSGTAWREARTVVRQRFGPDTMLGKWHEAARRFGLGAGAALPLMLRGRPRAVLHLYAAEEGVLDEKLIRLAEELAVDIGRALEAIDQQHHFDRLQALHAVLLAEGEVLLQARSEAEMLHRTCARLAESTLFQYAWIARPDEAREMQPLAGAGSGMEKVAQFRFALDEEPHALVVRAWLRARTEVCNNFAEDASLARFYAPVEEGGWQSAATVPILRGGKLFAILALGSPVPGLFTAEVLDLCERIAQLLGRGLDEFDLKQALEHERGQQFYLARHDPLTGLANRLLFEEHLGLALARARRRETPLAVCLLDLDDFKQVNDRWGHPAGDRVLREAADRLTQAMRRSDLIARLGGDEFVLAIEDLGTIEALPGLLGRLSDVMEAPVILAEGQALLRFSVGVAVYPADGADPDILLRRADAALYAAKAEKAVREQSWRRWDDGLAAPPATVPLIDDVYGPAAARLLTMMGGFWPTLAGAAIAARDHGPEAGSAADTILSGLPAAAAARLRVGEVAHLVALMDPAIDRAALQARARAVGEIHCLVGLDGAGLMQGIGELQTRLVEALAGSMLRPSDRQNAVTVALSRLHDDSAAQMEIRSEIIARYFAVVLRRPPPPETPWVDAVQTQLDEVAALPGLLSAGLLRPDAAGKFQVLASSTTRGLSFARIREATRLTPALDADTPEGQGLVGEAWRRGERVSAADFQTDPRTAPWHAAARRFGVQSAVVMPIRDGDHRIVAALILIGAHPAQFDGMWIRHFCAGLAEAQGRLWVQRRAAARAVVVPETTAAAWRRRLFTGGLRMHYQPLVDLRDGRPVGAEALARLEQEDGVLIPPGRFLPVLGARDLDELFRLGLAEALEQAALWEQAGLRLGVSLNLPPSTLGRPDCAFWVRAALGRARVAPARLTLELTEDQALGPPDEGATAAIAALAELGVGLAMDDLGSGFSSLHRLRSLPFGTVKLDQELMLDARRAPDRSMHFIGSLVQLGRDLDINVVAEGLESEDLIEAATVLGAHIGQGYALARPMPGAALADWARDFRWTIDRAALRTPLGALASMWRATHVGEAPATPVETCPITRFLETRGLLGAEIDARHRRLHVLAGTDGRASPRYRAEAGLFQSELARMTTGEG